MTIGREARTAANALITKTYHVKHGLIAHEVNELVRADNFI